MDGSDAILSLPAFSGLARDVLTTAKPRMAQAGLVKASKSVKL